MRILIAIFVLILLAVNVNAVVDDLRTFTNATGGVVIFPDSEGVARADYRVGSFVAKFNLTIDYFELADNNYNYGQNSPETDQQFNGCRIKLASDSSLVAEGTAISPNKCVFTSLVRINETIRYDVYADKLAQSRFMSANTSWPFGAGGSPWNTFNSLLRNGTHIIFNNSWGGTPSEFNSLMTVATTRYPPVYTCNPIEGNNHVTYNLLREEEGATLQSNNYIDVETFINVSANLTGAIYSTRISNTTNFTICTFTNGTYDFHLTYSQDTPDYANRYYDNKVSMFAGLSNWTRHIYNLNSTSVAAYSTLSVTLRKENDFNYFKDVYARLDRKYTGTGQWLRVQDSRSDEFGLTTFQVKEQDTEYRIYFYDASNNLILYTTPVKFVDCSTGTCTLTYLLNPDYLTTSASPAFKFTSSYNNVTGIIFVNWTESTGLSDYVTVNFTRETPTGSFSICSNQTNTSVGHIGCNVAGQSGIVYISARSHLNASGIVLNQYSTFFQVTSQRLFDFVGRYESGFWAFAVATTAAMFGVFSPVGSILFTLIGLIFVFALGIASPIGIIFIIVATAMGVAIGIKLKD